MSNPTASERRDYRRRPQKLRLRYRHLNHQFLEGEVHDLSREGAQIGVQEVADGPLIMEVKLEREWLRLIGHPVWARQRDGETRLGIRFFKTTSSILRKLDAWSIED